MDKKIELYTWSYCPFCQNAKRLLESKGYKYDEIKLDNDEKKREELIAQTGQSTVPFVFIDGELIGGYDDLKALDDKGQL